MTASLLVQTLLLLLFNIYPYLFKNVLNLGSHKHVDSANDLSLMRASNDSQRQ